MRLAPFSPGSPSPTVNDRGVSLFFSATTRFVKQLLLDLPPAPASLVASLRDIGYSFESAVADLVDNSITADARRIDVRALWNCGKPTVAVIDDGRGMSSEELKAAMRFGSTSPLAVRAAGDLGRFGLGMKTASISQCLKLQVLSKRNEETTNAAWDVGRICERNEDKWNLVLENGAEAVSDSTLRSLYREFLADRPHGTIIFWSNMDRMEKDGTEKSFNASVTALSAHLARTFHRLMKPARGGFSLFVNNREIEPSDPFNEANLACQSFPEESIRIHGETIKAQAFVLPHHSKTTADEYERFSGVDGYRGSQGFYVYRNKRLIISGTWFRLRPREELTKLVRIRVDIPNTLDSIWKIDIKKASADLPESVRQELRRVIPVAIERGKAVVRHRGYKIPSAVREPLWLRTEVDQTVSYSINKSGYAFQHFAESLTPEQRSEFESLVHLLESRLPTDQLYADICDHPKAMKQGGLDDELVAFFLDRYLMAKPSSTLDEVLATDPFFLHEELVKRLWQKRSES